MGSANYSYGYDLLRNFNELQEFFNEHIMAKSNPMVQDDITVGKVCDLRDFNIEKLQIIHAIMEFTIAAIKKKIENRF